MCYLLSLCTWQEIYVQCLVALLSYPCSLAFVTSTYLPLKQDVLYLSHLPVCVHCAMVDVFLLVMVNSCYVYSCNFTTLPGYVLLWVHICDWSTCCTCMLVCCCSFVLVSAFHLPSLLSRTSICLFICKRHLSASLSASDRLLWPWVC